MDTFSQEDFHIFASSNDHLRKGTVKGKFSSYLARNSWPRRVCNRTSSNVNKMLVRMTFRMVLLCTVSSQVQDNVLQHLSKVMEHGQHVTGLAGRCDAKRRIIQITLQTRLYGALSNKPQPSITLAVLQCVSVDRPVWWLRKLNTRTDGRTDGRTDSPFVLHIH